MRGVRELSEREEEVLQAVVHLFVLTAEPVGSRNIVKRFGLKISPATVRNVMSDLEEAKYLQQLHTSSGRVPTDAGYRYYVDYLMSVQEVTQSERDRIDSDFQKRLDDADSVLRETSRMLALVSHHTGIVESPSALVANVRWLDVTPLGPDRVVVLIADNYGRVRTITVRFPDGLTEQDASSLNRFLNDHLIGAGLSEVTKVLRSKIKEFIDDQHAIAQRALRIFDLMPLGSPDQLFLEGATQLFEQPEFHDMKAAREVFGLLEERDRVLDLLRSGIKTGDHRTSRVLIGAEDPEHGVEGISVVSAPYTVAGKTVGMVGVLGPRRMQYSRLSGIVEYTAGVLGRFLTRLAR